MRSRPLFQKMFEKPRITSHELLYNVHTGGVKVGDKMDICVGWLNSSASTNQMHCLCSET